MKKTRTAAASLLMAATIMLAMTPAVYTADTAGAPRAASTQGAEGNPAAEGAQSAATPKEEVVYALLNEDGSAGGVYVVNKFTLAQDGEVTDYGSYTSVRNMTDTAEIQTGADRVRFSACAGQFYYEGVPAAAQLPWRFSLRYTLDGRAVPAQQLAGQSGALRIDIDIAQNPMANPSFFEEYALQMTLQLDTERCQNIVADGATAANAGGNRQLTYTVLPGSEKSITLTTDVRNFEMEPISINGVRLVLDFEVDDEELLEQVTDLMDGAAELDDGARELADGVDELVQGVADLQDGVAEMQDGLDALDSESATLTDGSAQMKDALGKLSAALGAMSVASEDVSALVAASAEIQAGLDGLATGAASLQSALGYDAYKAVMTQNGADVDALMAGNSAAAASINDQATALSAMRDALPDGDPMKAQLSGIIDSLGQAGGLLAANNGVLAGLDGYFTGLYNGAEPLVQGAAQLNANYATFDAGIQTLAATLQGLPKLMQQLKDSVQLLVSEYDKLDEGINAYTEGVAAVVDGYAQMVDGVSKLAEGCAELQDGCAELTDGTATLREETDGMDAQITDKVDEMINDVSGGGDAEVVSFVSAQNSGIVSVQFVMRTDAIELPEATGETVAEPEEAGIWDRLLNLFR